MSDTVESVKPDQDVVNSYAVATLVRQRELYPQLIQTTFFAGLDSQEQDALSYRCRNRASNVEISDALGVSVSAVSFIFRSIKNKLKAAASDTIV